MLLCGSCHCQSVKFEVSGPVHRFTYCHCPDCRKVHGTPFSSNLVVASSGFKITAGEESLADYQSSPGKFRRFCKKCGAHVYARMNSRPEVAIVRAGLLDEDPGIRPQNHIWVSQKAPWFEITDSLAQFQEGFKG
jgi:hypothetical protein